MTHKCFPQVHTGIGSVVVGSVTPGFFKERKRGAECGVELCRCSKEVGLLFSGQGKTVVRPNAKETNGAGYECDG